MLRMSVVIAFGVVGFTSAFAQSNNQQYNAPKTVRQASAGESCAMSYKGCTDWCDRNRSANNVSGNQGCRSECSTYQATCEKTGTWSTPLGTTEIRGLSPKYPP